MTPERYFRVVGWDDFQHYRHRDPPWVKLHRRLLDNFAWSRLSDVCKGHLVGIWLLASRHDNVIPCEPTWIATRIGAIESVNLQPLVDAGFIEYLDRASKVRASRKQTASKVRASRKQNADSEKRQSRDRDRVETDNVFAEAWALYPRRPNNSRAAALRAWEARVEAGEDPAAMLDGTRRYAAYVAATSTKPQFVKLGSTFYGPDQHYRNDFTVEDPNRKIQVYVNDDGVTFTPEFLRAMREQEAAR